VDDDRRVGPERSSSTVGIVKARRIGRDFDVQHRRRSRSVVKRDGADAGEAPTDAAGADDIPVLVGPGVPTFANANDVTSVVRRDVDLIVRDPESAKLPPGCEAAELIDGPKEVSHGATVA
jgi:hypothetical protein